MKVFISGGSGFVGSSLTAHFAGQGEEVVVTGSSPRSAVEGDGVRYIAADTTRKGPWQEEVAESDVVINLAGRTIFNYWTDDYKESILKSRVRTTENIVEALPLQGKTVFLSASAAGFYGSRGEEILTEESGAGSGFLADVSCRWEKAAFKAQEKGIRTAVMRFGVVLGKKGGAMEKMMLPYRFFLGGPLGSGEQWFPWIALEDLVAAAIFIIKGKHLSGVFNFTSPESVRYSQFSKVLAEALNRPDFFRVPSFLLESLLGEFGQSLLASQRIVPVRLVKAGFEFRYADIRKAVSRSL